jgi:hypothetical protein
MSNEELLMNYEELCEDMEHMDFGSCEYDFASLELMSIEGELRNRGLK